MSEGAYPRPVWAHPPDDAEQHERELKERRRRRRAEIEWKRKHDAALKAGDMAALRALGPMYP